MCIISSWQGDLFSASTQSGRRRLRRVSDDDNGSITMITLAMVKGWGIDLDNY